MTDPRILQARKRKKEWLAKHPQTPKPTRQDKLTYARSLLASGKVSIREKFILGRWRICFYEYDASSPTGVSLWTQFEIDDPDILALLSEFGVKVRPGNVLFG